MCKIARAISKEPEMKRAIAVAACLACLVSVLPAQGKTIVADPLWDSLAVGGSLGAAVLSEFALPSQGERALPPPESGRWALDFPPGSYSAGIDDASTLLAYGILLTPGLFCALSPASEWIPAGAAYAEAFFTAYAAKNLLKFSVPKARPYAYLLSGMEGSLLDEAYESFPSGHTTLAFCAATSLAVLLGELAPESPWTPWLIGGGYALALTEAALRVVAGSHFMSDVAAGALLGSAIGFGVMELHVRKADPRAGGEDVSLSLGNSARGEGVALNLHYRY
jgi:membrane-associated phospholipid phosphatase